LLNDTAAQDYDNVFRRDCFNRDWWILFFEKGCEQIREGWRRGQPKGDYGGRDADSEGASAARER
jgi:hypothetical protein